LRAAQLGWPVTGWDTSPGHLEVAVASGAIGTAANSLQALAADADVLILATPLVATLAQLEQFSQDPPRAALVIDVASVKVPVGEAARPLAAFVGTHPIAGSERSGPEAARADLFQGRTWTYDLAAPLRARDTAAAFLTALGARPIAITNDEHDSVLALTSHLPQVLAIALGTQLDELAADPFVVPLCGTGMRSMLRLGSSAWTMWGAVLDANAAAVAQEVRRLTAILNGIADALEDGRSGVLADGFDAAARVAARLREYER
jgi:prephenate dehydrogenase